MAFKWLRVDEEGTHFYQLVSLLYPTNISFFFFFSKQDKETQDQYENKVPVKNRAKKQKCKKSWKKRKRRNRGKMDWVIEIEEED